MRLASLTTSYPGCFLNLGVKARPRLNLTRLIAVHTLRITVIDLREARHTKGARDALTPDTSAYSRPRRRNIDLVVPRPTIDDRRRLPNSDRCPGTAGQKIVTFRANQPHIYRLAGIYKSCGGWHQAFRCIPSIFCAVTRLLLTSLVYSFHNNFWRRACATGPAKCRPS